MSAQPFTLASNERSSDLPPITETRPRFSVMDAPIIRPPGGPTVLYIGNFKHPWCTEVHLARDLRNLGCAVVEMQEPDNTQDKAAFLRAVEERYSAGAIDIVMFTRTWGLPPEATDLWRRLEARGIVTCSYHLDLYVGLQREEGIERDPFWTTQYVFTPDGDPRSAEFFKARGINHHWLSPAVVSDACVPGVFEERFDYDVVFVGSEHYHPEWPWRPQLINHLRKTYGNRFRRFAGDMPGGPIREQALNNLYATAKVVVGDSLALPGHTNYWTDRYFETIGRGGFLVGPRVPGLEAFLTDGKHYIGYDHPSVELPVTEALARVADKINMALSNSYMRHDIKSMGQQHVARHHTYRHRLHEALKVMGFFDWPVLAFDPPVGRYEGLDRGQLDIGIIHDGSSPILPGVPPPEITLEKFHGLAAARGPVIDKLELGAGYHPTPGFITLDANPACNPDIVGPAFPLQLGDGTVGELRAVDVLEHISYRRTAEVLADWFRVLVPGGRLYVQVPDAALVMEWFVREPHRLMEKSAVANVPQTPLAMAAWRILGGHEDGVYAKDPDSWQFNAHYAMFSPTSLRLALEDAGFVVRSLVVNDHPNICCTAEKL